MKKLISVILILSMIFTLGITSMTASAKYELVDKWTTVSNFDFSQVESEELLDYSKFDGKVYMTAKKDASAAASPGPTQAFASSGASYYNKMGADFITANGYVR